MSVEHDPRGPSPAQQRRTLLIIAGALACGVLSFVLLFCGGVVAGVVHKGMQQNAAATRGR